MFVNAAQLRAARAFLDLSQAEVAEASGVSIPTLKRMESEKQGPTGSSSGNVQAIVGVYTAKGLEFLFDDSQMGVGVKRIKSDIV